MARGPVSSGPCLHPASPRGRFPCPYPSRLPYSPRCQETPETIQIMLRPVSSPVFTGRLNAGTFRTFLQAFLRGRWHPVFLVVDGHPAHRAHLIAEFVQAQRGRLGLHFLPGYAPDLNPDEFVWNHLRQRGVAKRPLHRDESLRLRVDADLATIKADPHLVLSFFAAPSVAYILN